MPLVVVIGIDNCGAMFNIAFSFIRTEVAIDYTFIFRHMKTMIFHECVLPRVVLADQGSGIQAALHTGWTSDEDGVFAQLCEWHCFQNIWKCIFGQRTYSKMEELDFIWDKGNAWLQCTDLASLNQYHQQLLDILLPSERSYLLHNWIPKERHVVQAYTRKLPNLGSNSTQRNDGANHSIKMFTHTKIQLNQTARAILQFIDFAERDIEERESQSKMKGCLPTLPGMVSLRHLHGHITQYAMHLLLREWIHTMDSHLNWLPR